MEEMAPRTSIFDLNANPCQIFSKNQGGDKGGDHLMVFPDSSDKVFCNGSYSSKGTTFKVFACMQNGQSLCVVQCIEGPSKDKLLQVRDNEVACRKTDIDFSSPRSKINPEDVGPDVLFLVAYNNDLVGLSLQAEPNKVIGFNLDGMPTVPTQTAPDQDASLFFKNDSPNKKVGRTNCCLLM